MHEIELDIYPDHIVNLFAKYLLSDTIPVERAKDTAKAIYVAIRQAKEADQFFTRNPSLSSQISTVDFSHPDILDFFKPRSLAEKAEKITLERLFEELIHSSNTEYLSTLTEYKQSFEHEFRHRVNQESYPRARALIKACESSILATILNTKNADGISTLDWAKDKLTKKECAFKHDTQQEIESVLTGAAPLDLDAFKLICDEISNELSKNTCLSGDLIIWVIKELCRVNEVFNDNLVDKEKLNLVLCAVIQTAIYAQANKISELSLFPAVRDSETEKLVGKDYTTGFFFEIESHCLSAGILRKNLAKTGSTGLVNFQSEIKDAIEQKRGRSPTFTRSATAIALSTETAVKTTHKSESEIKREAAEKSSAEFFQNAGDRLKVLKAAIVFVKRTQAESTKIKHEENTKASSSLAHVVVTSGSHTQATTTEVAVAHNIPVLAAVQPHHSSPPLAYPSAKTPAVIVRHSVVSDPAGAASSAALSLIPALATTKVKQEETKTVAANIASQAAAALKQRSSVSSIAGTLSSTANLNCTECLKLVPQDEKIVYARRAFRKAIENITEAGIESLTRVQFNSLDQTCQGKSDTDAQFFINAILRTIGSEANKPVKLLERPLAKAPIALTQRVAALGIAGGAGRNGSSIVTIPASLSATLVVETGLAKKVVSLTL